MPKQGKRLKVGDRVSVDRFCAANKPIGVITKLYRRGGDKLARVRWNVAMDLFQNALVHEFPRHKERP